MNYSEELAMKQAAEEKARFSQMDMPRTNKLNDEQVGSLKIMLGFRDELEAALLEVERSEYATSIGLGGGKHTSPDNGVRLHTEDNRALQNVSYAVKQATARLIVEELEKVSHEIRAIVA
jgi:hypothetical protein